MTVEQAKPDKTRQLAIEQQNAIEHLLQGKSDRTTAEAVGVSGRRSGSGGIMILSSLLN